MKEEQVWFRSLGLGIDGWTDVHVAVGQGAGGCEGAVLGGHFEGLVGEMLNSGK